MKRALVTISALTVSTPMAMAQAPATPPTRTIDQLEKNCRSDIPNFCARIAQHARQRYGDKVTPMQWQGSVRAVGYQISQGR